MTDALATDADREFMQVFRTLVAEREDPRTRLNVVQLGLLRHVARLVTSDDPKDARVLAELMPLAPSVINPGAVPALTLEQMDRDDAELDISRLSNDQFMRLEELHAVMCGAAVPMKSMRMESALALTWLLDGADGEPDAGRVRELVVAVLGPALLARVFPDGRDELAAERSRRLSLQEEVKRLERAVEQASAVLPENVVRLRREQQA